MIKRTRALILYKGFFQLYSVEQPFPDGTSYIVFVGNKADCESFMNENPNGFSKEECVKRENSIL